MNNRLMNIAISAAIHLARSLITECVWQAGEDSESFGLTLGTHLAPSSKKRALMEAEAPRLRSTFFM